jgi:hypothetical protein
MYSVIVGTFRIRNLEVLPFMGQFILGMHAFSAFDSVCMEEEDDIFIDVSILWRIDLG